MLPAKRKRDKKMASGIFLSKSGPPLSTIKKAGQGFGFGVQGLGLRSAEQGECTAQDVQCIGKKVLWCG